MKVSLENEIEAKFYPALELSSSDDEDSECRNEGFEVMGCNDCATLTWLNYNKKLARCYMQKSTKFRGFCSKIEITNNMPLF